MEQTSPAPRKKRSPMIFLLGAAVIVAAFLGIRSFLHNLRYEITDNAQVESRAVPVISRVAGFVDSLAVDDYEEVKAGETLIKIDRQEFLLAVAQAKADVLNAEADRANAEASYRNSLVNRKLAAANAAVQKSKLDKAQADLSRDEALLKEGAATQKQMDDSRATWDAATKQYAANLEQVNAAGSQVDVMQAQVQKALALVQMRKAALEQAQLKLTYCTIVAPVTGRIGKRSIEKGQYIQPGAPLFAVVNDERFWIIANFKETQLEKMKEGQEVNVVLDGYPDRPLKGRVASFSRATGSKFALLPPDNATGNFVKVTQRVPVKIELENSAQYKDILRAGLSAEVEVNIQ